jgi:hypothetical protein
LPEATLKVWKENLIAEMTIAARPFYESLWTGCSKDEKLALRQLAEEGVVNPTNTAVIAKLLRNGLVRRDPTFRPMNESFRRFVLEEQQADGLDAWEHHGVVLPWGSITATILSVSVGLTVLLFLSQQQLAETWTSYIPILAPALAPAFPTVARLVASIQLGAKGTKEVSG